MEVGGSSDEEELILNKKVKKSDFLSDEEDDDFTEDQVVWERDVVVCNSIPNTEMYCVSYPISKRDAWDNNRLPTARFKKNVQVLEVRFLPDLDTGSFDKKKGELLYGQGSSQNTPQKNVDVGSLRKNEEIFEGRAFGNDHPIVKAVGFMRDDKFYIHPMNGTFDMHRSIAQLNKKKKSGSKIKGEDDEEGTSEEEEEGPNTSAGNVRVKFSRPETDRQKKRREASALHREKKIASDVWIPMKVHLKEDKSALQKFDVICQTGVKTEHGQEEPEIMEIRELVNRAIICGVKEELVIESGKEHMLSKQRIDELELETQIKAHMVKSHVMKTEEMIRLIGNEKMDKETLIKNLQSCARLVNGVWVLQSDLLFNNLPPAHSNTAGKTDVYRAELWRNARDLALCLIDAGQRVTRLTLITCFRLSERDAEEILSTFGVRDQTTRTWNLRIPCDEKFLNDPSMQSYVLSEKKRWIEVFEDLEKTIAKNKTSGSPKKKQ